MHGIFFITAIIIGSSGFAAIAAPTPGKGTDHPSVSSKAEISLQGGLSQSASSAEDTLSRQGSARQNDYSDPERGLAHSANIPGRYDTVPEPIFEDPKTSASELLRYLSEKLSSNRPSVATVSASGGKVTLGGELRKSAHSAPLSEAASAQAAPLHGPGVVQGRPVKLLHRPAPAAVSDISDKRPVVEDKGPTRLTQSATTVSAPGGKVTLGGELRKSAHLAPAVVSDKRPVVEDKVPTRLTQSATTVSAPGGKAAHGGERGRPQKTVVEEKGRSSGSKGPQILDDTDLLLLENVGKARPTIRVPLDELELFQAWFRGPGGLTRKNQAALAQIFKIGTYRE